jgi:hypothetical protein
MPSDKVILTSFSFSNWGADIKTKLHIRISKWNCELDEQK